MAVRKVAPDKYRILLWWRENGRRRKQQVTVSGSQKDARRFEKDLMNKMKCGQLVAQQVTTPEIPTFREFADTWFQSFVVPNNKVSEQEGKQFILRKHLVPAFGHLRLDQITPYLAEQFKATQMRLGYAASTINLHLSCLKRALHSAVEWGQLGANPAAGVHKLSNHAEKWSFLNHEEAEKFLAAATAKWKPLFRVAMQTGLRKGELLALRWSDIDWNNRVVQVRHTLFKDKLYPPKSRAAVRAVPMTTEVLETLRTCRKAAAAHGSQFVFCSDTGTPLDPTNVSRAVKAANRRSGVKRIRFHDMRHTFASQMAMAGAGMRTIQELLGHSSLDMTLRYAHLTEEHGRRAVDKFERARQHFGNTPGLAAAEPNS